MNITAYQTPVVGSKTHNLYQVLHESLPATLSEKSIVVVSSKIIALCQGRVVDGRATNKETLLVQEADYYLPQHLRQGSSCTIVHNAFIGAAGIDESNADGKFVLLPENPQEKAREIQKFLKSTYGVTDVGVILTDSRSTPLRRGASGVSIGYAGFVGLKDYRGTTDIFGRTLKLEIANHVDALSTAAVLAMGEGNEQTPLVVIHDLPEHITFSANAPTEEERAMLYVPLEEDIFYPIIRHETLVKKQKPLS
jgi:dihydrofolate synthase / folylpolyglutamate synthase